MIIIKKIKKAKNIYKNFGFKEFIKRLFYFLKTFTLSLLEIFLYPIIFYKIKKINKSETYNIKELFNFAQNFLFGIIRPMQIEQEFEEFVEFVKERNIRVCVEIGTAKGGTLFLLSKILPDNALIVSIDLNGWPWSGTYAPWRKFIYKSFSKKSQRIFLLRGKSQSEKIINKAKKILGDLKIDLLFIDGDHSYKGVKEDFEKYFNLVKNNGIIALHDILLEKTIDNEGGVSFFWKELQAKEFFTKEFIYNINLKAFGIGLVIK